MKDSLKLYRRLLGTALPYWKVMALSVLAMIAAAALEPAMPSLLKSLVDKSMIAKDPVSAWRLPLLLLLAFLGKGLAEYIASVASQWVANKAVADLRQQVFEHQMDLPLSAHQAEPPGRMLSRILYDMSEPILAPARRILPTFGGVDWSPLVTMIVLNLLQGFVVSSL